MSKNIKNVVDKFEKKETYKGLVGKYNHAIQEGFFIEALVIDYAILEDRFMSFFYYLGLLDSRDSSVISEDKEQMVLTIVETYKKKKESSSLDLQSIEVKIKIIRSVILWASETDDSYKKNAFLTGLKTQIESLDVDLLLDVLPKIKGWKNYRNEIVHSLMNKNIYSLQSGIEQKCKEGMSLARVLDSQVKILKKKQKEK